MMETVATKVGSGIPRYLGRKGEGNTFTFATSSTQLTLESRISAWCRRGQVRQLQRKRLVSRRQG